MAYIRAWLGRVPEPLSSLGFCLAGYAAALALILPLYHVIPDQWHLIDEGGPVQTLSWVAWLVAGVGSLVVGLRGGPHRADWLAVGFLMIYLMARELDVQKAFTTWNLAHIPNYLDARIPLGERLAALLFYRLPPPAVFLWLLGRWWRVWLGGTLARRDWALGLIGWFGIGAACVLVDKLPHLIDEPQAWRWLTNAVEETLELAFALAGLLVLAWAWRGALDGRPVPAPWRGGAARTAGPAPRYGDAGPG